MKPAAFYVLPLLAALACSAGRAPIDDAAAAEAQAPPRSGREVVLRALEPPEPTNDPWKKNGVLSTVVSSLDLTVGNLFRGAGHLLRSFRSGEDHHQRDFEMVLSDGTRVGGLLFEYRDRDAHADPLLIASFGFLQDRWGTEAKKFYDLYLDDGVERLPAHVLILDHPRSGPFLAYNGNLSMGSYDDARIWIEVARQARRELKPHSIHAFGVSMSGQTVVHALIEDRRLGTGLFASGIAVSIAPDFQVAPGHQLALLPTREGVENPWATAANPESSEPGFDEKLQLEALGMLVENRFIPAFERARPGATVGIPERDLAVFFRISYEARVEQLRRQRLSAEAWNRDFSLRDLDEFLATTRIRRVVDRVETPLVLVSARNDPAVERWMFEEVVEAAGDDPWVASYETDLGGHFGFNVVYGGEYLGRVIRLMVDPKVLGSWNGAEQAPGSARLTEIL